jgi:hypothetical protein
MLLLLMMMMATMIMMMTHSCRSTCAGEIQEYHQVNDAFTASDA